MATLAYVFIITPVPGFAENADEAVMNALEHAVRNMLHEFQFLQRNVSATTNTLFTGKEEDGRTRFVWTVELELVSGEKVPEGAALAAVLAKARERLSSHATVSEPFVRSVTQG
jgi:hypothetical protein